MIKQLVSYNTIVSRVIRDFKPDTRDWVNDSIHWIADIIERVGVVELYQPTITCLKVSNGRAVIPCSSEGIIKVMYNGRRMLRTDDTDIIDCKCNNNSISGYRYLISGNIIKTDFDTGQIKLHHLSSITGEDGLPLVPSNVKFQDAAAWYIMSKLIMQGMQHPTITLKDALVASENAIYDAGIDLSIGDEDDEIMFARMWRNFSLNRTNEDEYYVFR